MQVVENSLQHLDRSFGSICSGAGRPFGGPHRGEFGAGLVQFFGEGSELTS